MGKMDEARERLKALYEKHCTEPSDIKEYLPTLYKYASECQELAELGVRDGRSTSALLLGLPQYNGTAYVCVDAQKSPVIETYEQLVEDLFTINYWFMEEELFDGDTDLPFPVDLMFIDSLHVYGHLKRQLAKNHFWVTKYILVHNTTVDAWAGETYRCWKQGLHPDNIFETQAKMSGYPVHEVCAGIWPAITEFLSEHPEWEIKERFEHGNGLTVLQRRGKSSVRA